MTQAERDNRTRYRPGDRGGHVESYFLKANDPGRRRAFWLKFTLFVPRGSDETGGVAEVWAIRFDADAHDRKTVGAKTTIPLAAARLARADSALDFGGSKLSPGATSGAAASETTRIAWDLRFSTVSEPLHLLPFERMYDLPLPKSKALTPYPSERFDGAFECDGERWDVSGWPGMQGHNWGRQHADTYAWAHCNRFEGEADAVFEGFSARVKVGPFTTPFLTAAVLRLGGTVFDLRGPRVLFNRTVRLTTTSWGFTAGSGDRTVEVSASCSPDVLAGLHYPNPDGEMTYCLNTKVGDLDVRLVERNGNDVLLRCRGAAALEIAVRDAAHGIPMLI